MEAVANVYSEGGAMKVESESGWRPFCEARAQRSDS